MKMQCDHRVTRCAHTLQQQLLAGENVQARRSRQLHQMYHHQTGDVLRQPHENRCRVQSLRQFYHLRRQVDADWARALICGFGCKNAGPGRDVKQTYTKAQMHRIEERAGG